MPTIAESIADLHSGADFLHDVATGPASGAGSQVTNPVDATTQDSVAKTIADAKTAILTDTYLKAVVKEVGDGASVTNYTCLAADTGKVVLMNSNAACTVTVPTGLDVGWNACFIQEGTGQVTFSVSGTTLDNYNGHTKTAGQDAMVTLVQKKTNVFHLAGESTS